ncbi:MAG: metallophosphoesterase family protein [Tissierella sp.]|uniref:metallophosphoesterase family protein n=1 Tax=Tissierella sp. TaxID=41274 RepID=UPI003F94B32F
MKIIHCADLHLDSKMETNFSREQAKERRYEILETFENMIGYALDNNVEVILIAGDMFDTPQNQQKTIKNRVIDSIREASAIDFLYLQGNHDHDDFFKDMEDKPENLKLFSKEWTSFRYGDILISGLEFDRDKPIDIYSKLSLNENDFNIVSLHGQISQYGSDKDAELINLGQLENKYIDYLALGHIHSYKKEKLDYRGVYSYSGCLEGRGFDEFGEKGFVLLDIVDKKLFTEFVSLAKRTFHKVEVDISGYTETVDINSLMEKELSPISKDDIVRLVFTGQLDEDTEIDLDYIEEKLKNRYYFSQVLDETEIKIDYLKYENDISLKGEFIRRVKELELSDKEKGKIIKMGINALVGKEVSL